MRQVEIHLQCHLKDIILELRRKMTTVIQTIATPSLERRPGCYRKQIVHRKFVKQNISSQGRNSLGAFLRK